jgi:hypothetical protein
MKASDLIKKYYHGSNTKLPVGTILRPNPNYESDWSHTDFYQVLEDNRPENMLAHKHSVFMCDNPDDIDNAGGGTEWMFTVVPLGPVQRHDLNWGSEISMLVGDEPENSSSYQLRQKIRKAAQNYWNGVPHHSESVWEYLTPSAKIIAVEPY